jgi:hypothetical protein
VVYRAYLLGMISSFTQFLELETGTWSSALFSNIHLVLVIETLGQLNSKFALDNEVISALLPTLKT